MDIKQVSVGSLKASAYNPRKWNQSAIDGLTESIKRFGLVDPLLVNSAKNVRTSLLGVIFA